MSDYTLSVDVTANAGNFDSAMDNAKQKFEAADAAAGNLSTKFKTLGGKMQSFGTKMTLGVTTPVVAAGAAIIDTASDYSENLNKVDVAFGNSADAVKSWADTAITQFGLSKNQALEATSLFGDMGTSMGQTTDVAADMSTGLAGLAGDMASFKNVGIDEAMTALKGVYTGETESLKNLGIVMTETNLSAFALAQGITKPMSEMSQAEKVQLRYAYVMEMTKNAQGDYARTSDGTANSIRTFKGSVNNLAIVLGSKLLPIITPMIQKATEMVNSFSAADPKLQSLILKVAGVAAAIGPLSLGIGTVVKGIGGFMSAGNALIPLLGGTGTGFKALGIAAKGFLAPLAPIIAAVTLLIAAVSYLWKTDEGFRNSMIATGQSIMTAVTPVIQQLTAVFKQVFEAIGPIAVIFASVIGKILQVAAPVIVFFVNMFAKILTVVIDVFSKILSVITGVFKKVEGAWDGLNSFLGGVFDGVAKGMSALVSVVEGFVNGVIKGVNFAIKLINKIPGVEIGLIPYLASGTSYFQGGPAVINERGGEIVNLPEGSQVIPNDLSKRYLSRTTSVQQSQGIDEDRLAEKIGKQMEKVTVAAVAVMDPADTAEKLGSHMSKVLEIARRRAQ